MEYLVIYTTAVVVISLLFSLFNRTQVLKIIIILFFTGILLGIIILLKRNKKAHN